MPLDHSQTDIRNFRKLKNFLIDPYDFRLTWLCSTVPAYPGSLISSPRSSVIGKVVVWTTVDFPLVLKNLGWTIHIASDRHVRSHVLSTTSRMERDKAHWVEKNFCVRQSPRLYHGGWGWLQRETDLGLHILLCIPTVRSRPRSRPVVSQTSWTLRMKKCKAETAIKCSLFI